MKEMFVAELFRKIWVVIVAFIGIMMLIFGFAVWLTNGTILKNQEAHIEVGKNYIFSLDWENEDPFEKIEIDTVKVVSIKGDYVQWEYRNGLRLSGRLKFFRHRQKPCH